mmetsp:Transcript_43705/g.52851  ORF Transcript_43705/g.52851 Transcript_43705/m.52851 type:complete len:126 (-) Transcript_43705:164-541(-)
MVGSWLRKSRTATGTATLTVKNSGTTTCRSADFVAQAIVVSRCITICGRVKDAAPDTVQEARGHMAPPMEKSWLVVDVAQDIACFLNMRTRLLARVVAPTTVRKLPSHRRKLVMALNQRRLLVDT